MRKILLLLAASLSLAVLWGAGSRLLGDREPAAPSAAPVAPIAAVAAPEPEEKLGELEAPAAAEARANLTVTATSESGKNSVVIAVRTSDAGLDAASRVTANAAAGESLEGAVRGDGPGRAAGLPEDFESLIDGELPDLSPIGPDNGGFEDEEDLTPWIESPTGTDQIVLDTVSPPRLGNNSAQFLGGVTTPLSLTSAEVSITRDYDEAMLVWADRVDDFGANLTELQQWVVTVTSDTDGRDVFSLQEGDPATGGWIVRSADIGDLVQLDGSVEVSFTKADPTFFPQFVINLDAVGIYVGYNVDIEIDPAQISPLEVDGTTGDSTTGGSTGSGTTSVTVTAFGKENGFDGTAESVTFGPEAATPTSEITEDANGDGNDDYVATFDVDALGLTLGINETCLSGTTDVGFATFEGCGEINSDLICGLGPELVFALPPLLWWRRRLRRAPA